MPIYDYSARDLQGVDHKGTIETIDEGRAARILSRRGLIVTSLKEQKETGIKFLEKYLNLNKVPFGDMVVSTRQLATMIDSGLVLSEALDILVEQQQKNSKFKLILSDISRDVKSGMDLATSIKKHPDVFPPLYSSLVRSGEQAGNLDIVLNQLATNLEKDREFKARIKGALIYPIMIIIMMVVVVGIMMFFVIPRLISLYTQSNIELPLPTKILIVSSNFMTSYWWLLLIMGVITGIVFRRWVATQEGRFKFDNLMLHTPIVGRIVKGSNLTYFTRTFGLLATAGVPILDSLRIIEDVIDNMVYKKAIAQAYIGVERGLTLSNQLEASGVFPKIISQMFKVGEETGKVDKVAYKLAEYFESEADNLVKNLTVIIEPVILVMLGIGVAFLVLSIILPIYKLTTSFT